MYFDEDFTLNGNEITTNLVSMAEILKQLHKEVDGNITYLSYDPDSEDQEKIPVCHLSEASLYRLVDFCERGIFHLCTELVEIKRNPVFGLALRRKTYFLAKAHVSTSEIVVRCSYLHKSLQGRGKGRDTHCTVPNVRNEILMADISAFRAEKVDCYVCSVYPHDVCTEKTIDPDNIAVKTVQDPLLSRLGIDDNGFDATLHCFSAHDDDVPPGTYFLITHQQKRPLGRQAVLERIKNAFSTFPTDAEEEDMEVSDVE